MDGLHVCRLFTHTDCWQEDETHQDRHTKHAVLENVCLVGKNDKYEWGHHVWSLTFWK